MAAGTWFERARRLARATDHAVFASSWVGRAGEIAAWSNAASAVAVAVATSTLLWTRMSASAAWLGLLAGAATLLVLRGALTRRSTAWISAVVGTLTIASAGGALAWLFGHVAETPAAPSIAAVLGAVVAALPPAWGYSLLARRTLDGRDSVVPSSAAPFSG